MTQTTSRTRPPESWYPDPAGRHDFRFWSGEAWTEFVVDGPLRAPSIDPVGDDPGTNGPGTNDPGTGVPEPAAVTTAATTTATETGSDDPHAGLVRTGQASWGPPPTSTHDIHDADATGPAADGKRDGKRDDKDDARNPGRQMNGRTRWRVKWVAVAVAAAVAIVGGVVVGLGSGASGVTVETLGARLERSDLGCESLTLRSLDTGTCVVESEPATIDTYSSEAALASSRAQAENRLCELAIAGTPVRSVGVADERERWTIELTSEAVARKVSGALGGKVWSINSTNAC